MTHLLVDAMNVIGSRPDGWWRDRDGAVRRLLAALQRHASAHEEDVTLFVDGRPLHDLPEGWADGVEVLYARRAGRDAADDRIVEYVDGLDDPSDHVVITSDRGLTERLRASRIAVHGARWLLDRLA